MAEPSYLDNPQFDDTPRESPPYKRGKSKGVSTMGNIIKDVLTGADNGSGEIISVEVEAIRRAVLTLRDALTYSSTKQGALSDAAKIALEKAKSIVEYVKI